MPDMDNDWGAHPLNDKEEGEEEEEKLQPIDAGQVWFKMPNPQEEGEMVDVNLLSVINQLFIDMGHFDMRVHTLEEEMHPEEKRIIMPD